MIISIIGPSGCGKGTQAQLLGEKLGLPAISTGKKEGLSFCKERP